MEITKISDVIVPELFNPYVINRTMDGRNDLKGDEKISGCEVLLYSDKSKAMPYAVSICEAIEKLGYKNRGLKIENSLYFLKKSKAPALLIEFCFVDDKDDVGIYNHKYMAKAIVNGVLELIV